jgi:hypothetical protein
VTGTAQLTHDALIYRSAEEFVAAVVPFVRGGLAQGEASVVATTTPNAALLRDALGSTADNVTFIDRDDWYRRPTVTVAGWKSRLDDAIERGHTHVRIVGEVQFGSEEQHSSWTRYESALNRVFADAPAWILCPYDARTLAPTVVEAAQRTHPAVLTPARRDSLLYQTPEALLSAVPEPMPQVNGVPAIRLAIDNSVAAVRQVVRAAATTGRWLPLDRIEDLLLVLSEVVANSLRHGAGRSTPRSCAR